MPKTSRLNRAQLRAESILRELRINQLPIDPFAIAAKHNIIVEAKQTNDPGVSGMLLRNGDNFGILYATHIASEGFQRFSIAHELGHYFLDGHIDCIFDDNGIHVSHAGFMSNDKFELEADQFAAGLLMPTRLFRLAQNRYDPGLNAIKSMAKLSKTSLTAAAIRYIELTEDAMAIIVSTGKTVEFCRISETMKSLRDITWIRKGSPVPRNSVTAKSNNCLTDYTNAGYESAEIDIADWFGGRRSIDAIEETVVLGSYGKTLTVITCPSIVDETFQDDVEDEDDEHELIERWTPRFRH